MPAAADSIEKERTVIVKPKFIPDLVWQSHYELGISVADLIIDAFTAYGSGDFSSWDKNRVKNIESAMCEGTEETKNGRDRVCEYILVEKMKKEDYFYCGLCTQALLNYKHPLIHFTSSEHRRNETAAVQDSGIARFRCVLDSFTKLPSILGDLVAKSEQNLLKGKGGLDVNQEILDRRTKEIEKAKAKPIYAKYLKEVPVHERITGVHPTTPNKFISHTRRSCDKQIKTWKRSLYAWVKEEPTESADEAHKTIEAHEKENERLKKDIAI